MGTTKLILLDSLLQEKKKMSDLIKKTVVIIDAETGSLYEYALEVSAGAKVEEIQDLLEIPISKEPLFFYNRCATVDPEDLIGEAYGSEDVVIVWTSNEEDANSQKTEEGKRAKPKEIKNETDHEIIVVARTKEGWPIFFDEKETNAVKFASLVWTKKIVLYRKGDLDQFGETIYKGRTYELDMGDNIAFYSYEDDGLHIYEKDQKVDPRLVYPVGDEIEARHSDFYQPIGKKLRLPFVNLGKIIEEA